jgi:hypothetical protein
MSTFAKNEFEQRKADTVVLNSVFEELFREVENLDEILTKIKELYNLYYYHYNCYYVMPDKTGYFILDSAKFGDIITKMNVLREMWREQNTERFFNLYEKDFRQFLADWKGTAVVTDDVEANKKKSKIVKVKKVTKNV